MASMVYPMSSRTISRLLVLCTGAISLVSLAATHALSVGMGFLYGFGPPTGMSMTEAQLFLIEYVYKYAPWSFLAWSLIPVVVCIVAFRQIQVRRNLGLCLGGVALHLTITILVRYVWLDGAICWPATFTVRHIFYFDVSDIVPEGASRLGY